MGIGVFVLGALVGALAVYLAGSCYWPVSVSDAELDYLRLSNRSLRTELDIAKQGCVELDRWKHAALFAQYRAARLLADIESKIPGEDCGLAAPIAKDGQVLALVGGPAPYWHDGTNPITTAEY